MSRLTGRTVDTKVLVLAYANGYYNDELSSEDAAYVVRNA